MRIESVLLRFACAPYSLDRSAVRPCSLAVWLVSRSSKSTKDRKHEAITMIMTKMMYNRMMMRTMIVALLWVSTQGFGVVPKLHRTFGVALQSSEDDHHIAFNPMAGYKSVDLDRAKDCAEHFGQCTVEEMQELRDSK